MTESNLSRSEIAMQNFLKGYNCAQSVMLAFSDLLDLDTDRLVMLSSSFGGGMGRLREVCGAVSSMFMITGLLYGYATPETGSVKKDHYSRIQELARRFEEQNGGSIVCRELLGLKNIRHDVPTPEARTEQYYKKRPCKEIIGSAAKILDDYLKLEPIKCKKV